MIDGNGVNIDARNPIRHNATSVFVYRANPLHTPHIFLSPSLL